MEWIRKEKKSWKKMGIIIGVYLGMKYLLPLVVPFLIAAVVVHGCWPLLRYLKERFRIRPAASMAVLLIVAAVVVGTGCVLLGRSLYGQLRNLCRFLIRPGQAEYVLYECCDSVSRFFHIDAGTVHRFVTEQMEEVRVQAGRIMLPGAFGSSWQAVKYLGGFGAALLVTLVAVLFLAADYERIREAAESWSFYRQLKCVAEGMRRSAGGYFRAQILIMSLIMLLCTLGIWAAGVLGNPIPAGIGIGLLDALPVFGTGTAFIPWILILVVFRKDYRAALILALTYGSCVLLRELLEPRLVGNRLGVLPVLILAGVYGGVKLYGVAGILLGPLSILLIRELWWQVDEEPEHKETEKKEASVPGGDASL